MPIAGLLVSVDPPELSIGARLAGTGLVGAAVLGWLAHPLVTDGRPVATILLGALAAVVGLAGFVISALPDRAARILRDHDIPLAAGAVAATALLFLDVVVVLGVPLVYATAGIERILAGAAAGAYTPVVPSIPELALRRLGKLAIWCGPFVAFLVVARNVDLDDVLAEIDVTGRPRDLLLGVAWTVPTYLLLVGTGRLVHGLGIVGPGGGGGAAAATMAHAVLISVTAGIGEEVFFRGFLQPRIGLVPQAIWFSLEHAAYLSIPQLAVALVAGLLFGFAYRQTESLTVPIVAHVLYDIVIIGF